MDTTEEITWLRAERDALAAALRGMLEAPRPAESSHENEQARMDACCAAWDAARVALANVEGGAK